MEVYLKFSQSLGTIDNMFITEPVVYNPTVDIRLSTLSYIAITRYNIPTDKLPKSLIRDDSRFNAVDIKYDKIRYYEKIGKCCGYPGHLHSYRPIGYNDREIDFSNLHGIIPPSVIFISTDKSVHLTSAVKYLEIYDLDKEFIIDIELEHLSIVGYIIYPIKTTKPIKFLYMEPINDMNIIKDILPFVKYVLFGYAFYRMTIPPNADTYNALGMVINSSVESILVQKKEYSHIKSKKVVIFETGFTIINLKYYLFTSLCCRSYYI